MKRRRRLATLGTVVAALYGAAVTAFPLLHNAWHHLAHHGHDEAAAAAHDDAFGRHGVADDRDGAPQSAPGDPEHRTGAPEHFGLALASATAAAPVPVLALTPVYRPVADTTVFRSSFRYTPANPRAPPRS
jgi:hypothetical protein